MKAIIIDDEKHVREGLMLLAEWDKFGIQTVLEAADGKEAMKLIAEHQPEIIFTDMNMPRCDGIELLKWIRSADLDSKTIVVSGYDDFKYTKNAITYGSFDYILKPINPNELNETLSRAVTEWKKQNDNILINLENDKMIWDHMLSNALNNEKIPSSLIGHLKREFGVNIAEQPCSVALLPMKILISTKFEDDVEYAFSSVLPICNEVISHDGIAFRNRNMEAELVLLLWSKRSAETMIRTISQKVGCPIIIGDQETSLKRSYDSASNKLKNFNLIKNEIQVVDSMVPVYLLDYSEEIKWAIQSGSLEQMDEILNKVFAKFEERQYLDFDQIKVWESQFAILKDHWLKEYELKKGDLLYKGIHYWNEAGQFSFTKFKEEKRKEFHHLMKMVSGCKFQKEKNNVQVIEEFIRKNYQKDIKLQEIADRFFLSREYISRKFKQEYNETITDYLMQIRIEKAKELLNNPHLKIYEISDLVGYQNDKYFIKVFKRRVGVTPSEYRNSLK
ncbi:response regulator [Alkalihalobacillus sp. MEB130]|uniref:response regulator transcription factor n=1 Tax=Alkalihalobacillus sp. MEB130 TaxID=2976704 RepID=UPI0028DEBBA4|nr:response regulator [Alkalihalobacillus sp. MEB130]MDT8859277.1 response regulator [Alkalihalobacillus sp. MEB130]